MMIMSLRKNKLKTIFVIVVLLAPLLVMSQVNEDKNSMFIFKWFNSNVNNLDSMLVKLDDKDSLQLKYLQLMKNQITSKSFLKTNGVSERERIIFLINKSGLRIDLYNSIIIEEWFFIDKLKYQLTLISHDMKLVCQKEKGEFVISSIEKVSNYNNFLDKFDMIKIKDKCDDGINEYYQTCMTRISNGSFDSKVNFAPCLSYDVEW